RAVLVAVALSLGNAPRDLTRDQGMSCVRMLEPDVGDLDLACVQAPRRHRQADFLAMEGDCRRRLHADRGDLACRRVDARGHVDRHHRYARAANRVDRASSFLARLTVQAGAEYRVDYDVRRRQPSSYLA